MSKAPSRWFLVSLVHPALSALGLVIGSTNSGAVSYAAALLAFVANLPGIFSIKAIYYSTPGEYGSLDNFFCFWMIAVTWLLVVVPACYLTSRFLSKRALP
ncbi:MAG: hypothetical protein ACRDBP_09455 [Luteolibacter sp.]